MKKIFMASTGLLAAAAVALLPINGLGAQAKSALAVLTLAIVWWIFKILPDFVTALIMGLLFHLLAGAPMGTVFSAFSGSTWWLLLAAFGLSLGICRCGLLRRMSMALLRLFPKSFLGCAAGLTAVGFISAPFIPSMSAKAAVLAPLALDMCDAVGYARKEKQAAGLFLAMLTGLRSPGPLFVSASVIGYALRGVYPDFVNRQFTMGRWFVAALPWFIMVTVLTLAMLYLLYRPAWENGRAHLGREEKTKPMEKKERRMALIVLITLILWVTEDLHGIPAHLTALAALCLSIAAGVVSAEEFCTGMNWDSLVFIGFALGIAPVFEALGINTWITAMFSPVLTLFAGRPWAFLLCVSLGTVLLRFLIVSEIALINLVMVFLIPMAQGMGLNPWVVGFTVYAVISPWFFLYQNPVYMAAYYATGGQMIKHSRLLPACLLYLLICMAAILASIPFWIKLGIFYQ